MSKVIALYSPAEQGGTWGNSHAILPTHSPLFGNILKLSKEPLIYNPFPQQTSAYFLPVCVDRFLCPHWFLDLLFKHQVILQMNMVPGSQSVVYRSAASESSGSFLAVQIGVSRHRPAESQRGLCVNTRSHGWPCRWGSTVWAWEALRLKGGLIWPLC